MALFSEIPSVYSASKFDQKVTEAPASITVVTASEIQLHGYRTLADIIQSVPGFYTTYDRNYAYIGGEVLQGQGITIHVFCFWSMVRDSMTVFTIRHPLGLIFP